MKTKTSKRVVATGMSMITPLGRTYQENWANVLASKSGIRHLSDMHGKCRIGGRLPEYDLPETTMKSKIHSLAKALAVDLLEDAQFNPISLTDKEKWRTGCILANQYGVQEIRHETAGKLRLVKQMPHVVSSMIALDYEIRGQNGSPAGASVGSAIAIGEAYRLIKDGYMDRIIVGGLDYNCNQNVLPGMDAFGALCNNHNKTPELACKPFDVNRSGTVVSDGGAMILLESEEFAHKRNAKKIYGEVIGYGQTNDAHHILRPYDNGLGILAAIMSACNDAGIHPLEIDAVNCHARSTVSGDNSEAYCLHSLFACADKIKSVEEFQKLTPEEVINYFEKGLPENQPLLCGQKGHLGHAVAAAGAIESVFSFLSIQHQHIPEIKNLKDPLDLKLKFSMKNQDLKVDIILKNGFVFGGVNCSILFKKY